MHLQSLGGAILGGGERLRCALSALLLLGCLVSPLRVFAQDTIAASDEEVRARIAFIQGSFDAGHGAANRWWYGWLAAYGAGTAAQAAIGLGSDDEHQRQDMLVGGATSALGAAGQLVFPLHAGRFGRQLRELPESTLEQRRSKLAAAEAFLKRAADEESFGRSWKNRLLSLSVNGSAGLVTSLAFDRPATDGLIAFGIGQLVSELQLFSQPMKAVRDYRTYVRRTAGDRLVPERTARVTWSVAVSPARVSITRSF